MARKTAQKESRNRIPTIIGAGLTEQWYFTHLRNIFNFRLKVKPRYFGKEDIQTIEKRIKMVLSDGGIAICVFDTDVTTWNKAESDKLDMLRKKYENNKDVVLCDSMPSIEYWFLLHYCNTRKHFGTSKAVIGSLSKFLPTYSKTENYLRNQQWVELLSSDGKLDNAYNHTKLSRDEDASYSHIDKALDLIGYQHPETQSIKSSVYQKHNN